MTAYTRPKSPDITDWTVFRQAVSVLYPSGLADIEYSPSRGRLRRAGQTCRCGEIKCADGTLYLGEEGRSQPHVIAPRDGVLMYRSGSSVYVREGDQETTIRDMPGPFGGIPDSEWHACMVKYVQTATDDKREAARRAKLEQESRRLHAAGVEMIREGQGLIHQARCLVERVFW